MAHVLRATSRVDGLTEVQVSTGVTTIITLLIKTPEWYAMTADVLDHVVAQAVREQRPGVGKRRQSR